MLDLNSDIVKFFFDILFFKVPRKTALVEKINEIITSDITQNLKKDKLIELHNEYPFGHSYDINGNLIYWNKEENYKNVYQWMITWWNTFAPEDIYFKSLVNSGNLVLIDDYDVSREIEAVYTTRKERVVVNFF